MAMQQGCSNFTLLISTCSVDHVLLSCVTKSRWRIKFKDENDETTIKSKFY